MQAGHGNDSEEAIMGDLEKVKALFAKDQFASETGIVVDELSPGYARCSFIIEKKHLNGNGKVMGGAMYTLADFTFALAANADRFGAVSQNLQIAYLSTAKGKQVIAEAKKVRAGRSTCFYTVEVSDDLGNRLAYVTASGFYVE